MTSAMDIQTLKPGEAANFLRIGTKALRKLDSKLKPIYLNSRVKRYPANVLRDFVNARPNTVSRA